MEIPLNKEGTSFHATVNHDPLPGISVPAVTTSSFNKKKKKKKDREEKKEGAWTTVEESG